MERRFDEVGERFDYVEHEIADVRGAVPELGA